MSLFEVVHSVGGGLNSDLGEYTCHHDVPILQSDAVLMHRAMHGTEIGRCVYTSVFSGQNYYSSYTQYHAYHNL